MFGFFKRKQAKQPQPSKKSQHPSPVQQPKQPKSQIHSRPSSSQPTKRPQPQSRSTSPSSTERTLTELGHKIQQLEKQLEKLSGSKSGFENRITIQNLTMKEPVLKELVYELDQLKLDTVSGALNLGNNFGVEIGQNLKKKKSKSQSDRDEEGGNEEDASGFKRTGDGFRFRFDQE